MVDPSRLAETVTPSSFWPVGELIAPLRIWSAACADAVIPSAATTAAALANSMLRICVMVFLRRVMSVRSAGCRRGGYGNGFQKRNHVVNVGIAEGVFPARHQHETVLDDLMHELVIAIRRRLVERR